MTDTPEFRAWFDRQFEQERPLTITEAPLPVCDEDAVIRLGRLAAECELRAGDLRLSLAERMHQLRMADQYRTAQFIHLQGEPYPHATVLPQRAGFTNLWKMLAATALLLAAVYFAVSIGGWLLWRVR